MISSSNKESNKVMPLLHATNGEDRHRTYQKRMVMMPRGRVDTLEWKLLIEAERSGNRRTCPHRYGRSRRRKPRSWRRVRWWTRAPGCTAAWPEPSPPQAAPPPAPIAPTTTNPTVSIVHLCSSEFEKTTAAKAAAPPPPPPPPPPQSSPPHQEIHIRQCATYHD